MTQDKFDFLLGVSDEAFARYNKIRAFEQLTEVEQVFVCVWALTGQVNNGGFHQYYFNSSGDLAVETIDALKKIGAKYTTDLLVKANGYFENGIPPKNREARIEQLDKLTEQAEEELEDLDDIMYQDKDGLDELMYAFVMQNGERVEAHKDNKLGLFIIRRRSRSTPAAHFKRTPDINRKATIGGLAPQIRRAIRCRFLSAVGKHLNRKPDGVCDIGYRLYH